MEETPICASVERDLQLDVDELTASLGTGPVTDPAGTAEQSSGPRLPSA